MWQCDYCHEFPVSDWDTSRANDLKNDYIMIHIISEYYPSEHE